VWFGTYKTKSPPHSRIALRERPIPNFPYSRRLRVFSGPRPSHPSASIRAQPKPSPAQSCVSGLPTKSSTSRDNSQAVKGEPHMYDCHTRHAHPFPAAPPLLIVRGIQCRVIIQETSAVAKTIDANSELLLHAAVGSISLIKVEFIANPSSRSPLNNDTAPSVLLVGGHKHRMADRSGFAPKWNRARVVGAH
jgi:hypothetical protein